jgi:molybdopterin molybdotransferase
VISVEEARARILAPLTKLSAETVPLTEAWNRVLAGDVMARLTQPASDVSAMDGYALRTGDVVADAAGQFAALTVIGAAPAGHPFAGVVGPGQAVRIFTGSVVPEGADCVLLQEDADRASAQVTPLAAVRPAQHVRPRGQDFIAGDIVLRAGTPLGARQIGLAAAANHAWLSVHRQPRVAILATGDEVALPGDPVPPGGLVSSNSFMLAAMVRAAGGVPVILPVARDAPDAIALAVDAAQGSDILVTTGGASVGDHDLVQAGLGQRGFVLDFWKIAMRPGKPMISGRMGGMAVLGLPGNPVSAAVCATLFLLPALARLRGLAATGPATVRAVAGAAIRANDHRADHLRATLVRNDAGAWIATPFARQDSAMLTILSSAHCLVLRAPFAPAAAMGDPVEVILLDQAGL